MADVQRTPPKSQKSLSSLNQTQSEPDISAAVVMSENVTSRHKRRRSEHSPQSNSDQGSNMSVILDKKTTLIAKLVSDAGEIKAQNKKIQESNIAISKTSAEIERSMSFMNMKFEELKKEVEDLRKDCQQQRGYIETLEKKILDLQHKSRSSGIEIRNIPQSDVETTTTLAKTVCEITKLVGMPVPENELRDVYRLPGKPTSTTTRPIIAEFTTVRTKLNLLSAIRSYNNNVKTKEEKLNTELIGIPGKRQSVHVTEQLPPSSKKLFYLSREFSKNSEYTFCWISNGNIFLRKKVGEKQILINSEKSLEELGNKNK